MYITLAINKKGSCGVRFVKNSVAAVTPTPPGYSLWY